MKILKSVLTFVFAVVLLTACKNEKKPEIKTVETATMAANDVKKQLDPNATYAKAEFNVEGMTCAVGCAKKIEKTLANLEGVKSAKVDFDKKLAMVEYDVAKVTPESLTTTVTTTSDKFKVSNMQTVDAFKVDQQKKPCCKGDKKDCEKKCAKEGKKACSKGDKKACTKKDGEKACCAKKRA